MFNTIALAVVLLLLGGVAAGGYLLFRAATRHQPVTGAMLSSEKSRLGLRLFILLMLGVLSLIPLGIIQSLSHDRSTLYHQVVREIGKSWGGAQTLAGPALVIPYEYDKYVETQVDGETQRRQQRFTDALVILPKNLTLDAKLQHQFRQRGIYQSLVYQGDVSGQARFEPLQMAIPGLVKLHTEQARVVFGVSDNQAIEQVSRFNLAGETAPATLISGTDLPDIPGLATGFQQHVDITDNQPFTLEFALSLRGSDSLNILPLGESSQISINADWPHPSFKGYLPAERNISRDGFNANWHISHLTRNFPQIFNAGQKRDLTEVTANVTLFEPVTHYGKIERSLKYGILFILLTYVMLLIFELGQKSRLSTVQYVMVGGAMCLFYMLLLSLSEHLPFLSAYLVATAVPLIAIPLYVTSATGSKRQGGIMVLMLAGLYAVLYSILQLEDYALLMGTGLLLVIMLTLMYLTRHSGDEQ
ncbi:cell envelope integrity protein CreD [Shewanella sp. YIC-542]|uniref:cell envelope integrity protein CreD n=1 Tax=Shewanella mytili TaxID=3377111 RepID=UPI00398EE42B